MRAMPFSRTRRARALPGLCALAWLLVASSAAAQGRSVDVQRFVPALDAHGFIGISGTRTLEPKRLSLGWFTDVSTSLASVEDASGAESELVQSRVGSSVSAELGLSRSLSTSFALPMVLYQEGELPLGMAGELPKTALADPWISARLRVYGETGDDPMLPKDGPGLAIESRLFLPLGQEDAFAGEPVPRVDINALFDFQLLGAGFGATVGYRERFESQTFYDVKLDRELTFGAALKLPLPSLHPLSALLEVRGATDFRSEASTAIEGDLGLRASFGELVITAAAGAGFNGALGEPGVRGVLGLHYAPHHADTDRDGIADDDDQCPPLPEDLDGFEDDDGCPDPDNDNDLIPDVDDLCPLDEALEGQDDDEDGCTDSV
jgi:hypothetical protein